MEKQVDLNTFEWFYNFAPLHLIDQRPVGLPAPGVHRPPKKPGTLYYCTSDMICGQYKFHGYFFVASIDNGDERSQIEILHHACEWEDDSNEVWFYKLKGSGVFLRPEVRFELSPLHETGRVVEIVSKDIVKGKDFSMKDGRRVLGCKLFSSGWNASKVCNCDDKDAFMTFCRHPPVQLHRRKLLGKYLC